MCPCPMYISAIICCSLSNRPVVTVHYMQAFDLAAGAASGIAAVMVSMPFDVIKVRADES